MRDYWDNLRLFNRNIRFFLTATAVHGFVFFGIYTLLLNLYLVFEIRKRILSSLQRTFCISL